MIIIWELLQKILQKALTISKDDQDKFAAESQNKTEKAQKNNNFKNEIIPIEIKSKKETLNLMKMNFQDMEQLLKS